MRNRTGILSGIHCMPMAAFAVMVLGLLGCGGNHVEQQELQAARGDYAAEKNLVDTMTLRHSSFNREIISNGNLRAVKKADLTFKSSGVVKSVFKKDGDAVKKGDTIVMLDREPLKLSLEQARIKMEQASLDYTDKLLGFGYGKDAQDIPAEIAKVADIRSGYSSTKHSLKLAEINYANGAIVAPFNGIVANLSIKPYEKP
ncbi:MAG: biotin/lipoyl-binding protein, partial [Bacteroidales bacterium]|nr:biotin/lipoyl-binding protein [Bacteroidales bacterium]